GRGTLLCFVLQIVTGICLAFVYVPSADEAYTSLTYLNEQQTLGWFLRAIHYWGSNFMVGIMLVHMAQVFLFGAYKYPRELTWISGCMLLLCTLGMAFTGQVLRFDQDAYWGLGIGASMQREGVPFVPQAIGKDLIFSGLVILGILGCAAYFGPKGPEGVPDPTYIRTVPRPDVFFLWLYAVLALLPDYLETVLILVAP